MADINLTASMRSNLLSLQNTQSLMDMTSERLSTGKKVNSAIDNPASYYTSSSLENRAGDLSALMDSMGQGISTLKATDEAIMSITTFVEQAKAIVFGAAELVPDSEEQREVELTIGAASATAGNDGDSFSVIKDGRRTIIELENGDTAEQVAEKVQDALGDEFMLVPGATAGDPYTIEYTGSSAVDITIDGANSGGAVGDIDQTNAPVGGVAPGGAVAGEPFAFTSLQTGRADALQRYNEIMIQVDNLADDASYKGVNLLDGKEGELTVYFNEDRSSSLKIDGVDATSFGLKLSDDLNTAEVEGVNDLSTNELVNAALTTIDNAIDQLRSYAADFGDNYAIVQNREEFTKAMINVLTEGSDKLVLADMNEEGANMLALQTRQELATNSLSLASQAAQSVLKLFG